jgi:3-oxoacyl-[acyl-carrier protein] reductase
MMPDFTGKTALITGGGVGIGRDTAIALAASGARVAVTYLSHEPDAEFREQVAATGGPLVVARLDVTQEAEIALKIPEVAEALGGRIDILVNNAGGLIGRVSIPEMEPEHWRRVIEVNLNSVFYVTRSVLPFMTSGWGRVINVSSLAGHNGGSDGSTPYASAKAGLFGFTRGLAKELAPRGITVNAVAPGLILGTPFHATFTPLLAQQEAISRIPLGRPGTPMDVAGCIAWLSSDSSSFVTGSVIDINGGQYFR